MRKLRILLAEDSRADIGMVREALNAHKIEHELDVTVNGEEALAFIARIGKPAEPACPDILLLDLNLPRADGLDVLREFRRHPLCATTPVIVMSSSNAPRDREAAGICGVTCYFTKPMSYEAFIELGQLIKDAVGEETPSEFEQGASVDEVE